MGFRGRRSLRFTLKSGRIVPCQETRREILAEIWIVGVELARTGASACIRAFTDAVAGDGVRL